MEKYVKPVMQVEEISVNSVILTSGGPPDVCLDLGGGVITDPSQIG